MTLAPYPTAIVPSEKVYNTVAYQNNIFIEHQISQDEITTVGPSVNPLDHHHPEPHLEDYRYVFHHQTPPDSSTSLIASSSLYQQFQWEK